MWWVGGIGAVILAVLGGKTVYDKAHLAKLEGDAAERYGFPRWWFIALGLQETGLVADKVNLTGGDALRGGSWGLNQISLLTARKHGFQGEAKDLLNPVTNVEWTGHILSSPLDRWDRRREAPTSFAMAASMWNGGFYPGDQPPPGGKPVKDATQQQVAEYVRSASGYGGAAERMA